jgi:hypothetical protein
MYASHHLLLPEHHHSQDEACQKNISANPGIPGNLRRAKEKGKRGIQKERVCPRS